MSRIFKAVNAGSEFPLQPVRPDRSRPEEAHFVPPRDYQSFRANFEAVRYWLSDWHSIYKEWISVQWFNKAVYVRLFDFYYENLSIILQHVEQNVDETTYHCFVEPLGRLYQVLANHPITREDAGNALYRGGKELRWCFDQFECAYADVFGQANLPTRAPQAPCPSNDSAGSSSSTVQARTPVPTAEAPSESEGQH